MPDEQWPQTATALLRSTAKPRCSTNLAGNFSFRVALQGFSGTQERTAFRHATSSNDYRVFKQSFSASRRLKHRDRNTALSRRRKRRTELSAGPLTIGLNGALHIREERLSIRHDACRLMYVSDIHLRRTRSDNLCRQVIESARSSEIDVLLLGGDLVDGPAELGKLCDLVGALCEVAPVSRCWRQPRQTCRYGSSPRRGRERRGQMDSCRRRSSIAWFSSDCRVRPRRGVFTRG